MGDIDGVAYWEPAKGWWRAEVTVTVHRAYHGLLGGALVDMTWTMDSLTSGPVSVNVSCTTDANGRCTVASLDTGYKIDKVSLEAQLHVDAVEFGTVVYAPGLNHDEEGDSDGTTITLLRPPQ